MVQLIPAIIVLAVASSEFFIGTASGGTRDDSRSLPIS